MTDLEKELREFLAREKRSADEYHPDGEWDDGYFSGHSFAFERVIEWLDGDR